MISKLWTYLLLLKPTHVFIIRLCLRKIHEHAYSFAVCSRSCGVHPLILESPFSEVSGDKIKLGDKEKKQQIVFLSIIYNVFRVC